MNHSIRFCLAPASALLLVLSASGGALAADVSTKKLLIKDNVTPAKRQVQALAMDAAILYAGAVAPDATGAAVHVYSATDDFCVLLDADGYWKDTGKSWKYKNPDSKNQATIADGKLSVKIKSNVGFTLSDNVTQGTVSVQVQLGELGTRYCMTCTTPTKDTTALYLAKACVAATCPTEPSSCSPVAPPPTTTTTLPPPPPATVVGALAPPTTGRFNYAMTLGVAGADSACNTNFAGSHACTYLELQGAVAGGSMANLRDTANVSVTSFWAIDSARSAFDQCGASIPWDYQTAHTSHKADVVALNNMAGTLGTWQEDQACGSTRWVGCCQ